MIRWLVRCTRPALLERWYGSLPGNLLRLCIWIAARGGEVHIGLSLGNGMNPSGPEPFMTQLIDISLVYISEYVIENGLAGSYLSRRCCSLS